MPSPATPLEAQLSPDRCPNCGKRLKFPESRAEGLCPSCGIYVEILSPLAPGSDSSPGEDVKRRRDLAVMYLNLEEMEGLDELSEEPSEPETPSALESSVQEPLQLPEPEAPPYPIVQEPRKRASPPWVETRVPPAEPPTPVAVERVPEAEPAPPPFVREALDRAKKTELMDLCKVHRLDPTGTKQQLRERLMTFLDEHEARSRPLLPAVASEPEDRIPETPPATSAAAAPVDVEPLPEPIEEEAVVEPDAFDRNLDELEIMPVLVPPDVVVLQAPEEEVVESVGTGQSASGLETVEAETEASVEAESPVKPRRRDRIIFYVGAVHVVLGGAGLLLGSILHDLFRVPFIGQAYEAFGPLNVSAAGLGGLLLAAGVGAMALGARGGIVRPEPEGAAEG